MDVIAINKLQYLQIGVQGENAANSAPIDMTEWVNEYPNSRFHLLFKPYNSTSPLPMVTDYDGETHILTWTPTLSATAVAGVGYTEIRALDVDSGVLKKSRIIPTSVENSVTGVEGGTVPLPYEDWVNLVLSYKDAAEDAQAAAEYAQGKAEDAQEAAETAQDLAEDAQEAAETAQGKAEDAQEAAETAQGKAEDAQTAAETAQGAAEDAQTAAETAQGKAEDAQEAAESAQASAAASAAALNNATASATTLSPGSAATANIGVVGGVKQFQFGIPRGADAIITATAVAYQESTSGTTVPSGTWLDSMPSVTPGNYLWIRYTYTWNSGNTSVNYTVSRMGVDGSGSASAVKMNNQVYNPDSGGIIDIGTVITEHQTLPDGTTSAKGMVQLEDSTSSTSTDKAATPNSVKAAYDLANGKANPSAALSLTAAAGSWSSATPPTQTIAATGVTATNNIIVGIGSGATEEQLDAVSLARILCTAQGAGTITLTAYGGEPSVNIPISVLIVG